jgi:hypothetical protein
MIAPAVLAGLIGQDLRHKWFFVRTLGEDRNAA